MTTGFLALAFLCTLPRAAEPQKPSSEGPHVAWTWATEKVLPTDHPHGSGRPVHLRACRNEWVPFQLVFRSDRDIDAIDLNISDLAGANGDSIPSGSVEFFRVEYVPLTSHANTTFPPVEEIPDPLPALKGSFRLTANRTQPIWVNIRVPEGIPAGIYEGTILAEVGPPGGQSVSIPLRLEVWDFTLPKIPHTQSSYAIWFNLVERYYGLAEEKKREVFDRLYWFQVDHWLPPADLPVPVMSPEAEAYLDHPMVFNYRMPYSHDIDELRKIHDYLQSKGWLEKGYFYVYDEPGTKDFPNVRAAGHKIFTVATDWRYLITTGPTKALYNCVNIWVPMPRKISKETIRERQAAGDEMWWYTCIGPQKPYPTFFIDEWGTAPVVFFWLQVDYGYTGSLYWATTAWLRFKRGEGFVDRDQAPDIYDDPVRYPNVMGDGFLIWPARDGTYNPVASIRLKLVREGLEDAEYLYLLTDRLGQVKSALNAVFYEPRERAQEMVRRVARDFTSWTRDPEAIEKARAEVAEEILAASETPLALIQTEPPELTESQQSRAKIRGIVEPGTTVELNGRPVPTDRFGQFVAERKLRFGENRLRFNLTKDGKERRIERTLLRVKPGEHRPDLFEGVLSVPKLSRRPDLNGDFSSPGWEEAAVFGDLVDPRGQKNVEPTKIYFGYTDDALYVGFICTEPEIEKLRSAGTPGDEEIWTGDTVEVYLDHDAARSSYYLFGVNPEGLQADFAGDRESFTVKWEAFWSSFTGVGEESWIAQMEIPFASMGQTTPKRGQKYCAQFVRRRRGAKYEFTGWSAVVDYKDLDRFGTIVFE